MSRLALLLLLACLPSCRGTATKAAPHVVVIVVDTLRADRVGWYGGADSPAPFLDAFARRSTVYWRAYAASSWTSPSVASLWTSRWPSQHGVTSLTSVLRQDEQTLAETLRAAGYATAGFGANPALGRRHGWAQGFETYEVFPKELADSPDGDAVMKARAETVNEAAIAWLDARPEPAKPLFLYLHYMEPHFPYALAPERQARVMARHGDPERGNATLHEMLTQPEQRWRWLRPDTAGLEVVEDLYDGEVMALDAQLAQLMGTLEARGILQDAVVVITADHGEELMEHGRVGHGRTLYDEVLHVPLLVRLPGGGPRVDVRDVVSLVDVAPTVLGLAGVPVPPSCAGRSLPAAAGAPVQPAFAELLGSFGDAPSEGQREAVVSDGRVLIRWFDGTLEAYDLAADPRQATPLHDSAALSPLHGLLLAHTTSVAAAPATPENAAVDDATRDRLRALGYAAP